jgi:hypothetical protein
VIVVAFGSTMYSSSSTLANRDIGAALDTFVRGRNARLCGEPMDLSFGNWFDGSLLCRERSTVLLPFKAKSKYTPGWKNELAKLGLRTRGFIPGNEPSL